MPWPPITPERMPGGPSGPRIIYRSDAVHPRHHATFRVFDPRDFLAEVSAHLPDAHEAIEDMLAEGDKVAVAHRFRGTQHGPMGPYPPSGKVMATDYLAIYRVGRGVIVEAWAEWDNLSGLVQLGHYKPRA